MIRKRQQITATKASERHSNSQVWLNRIYREAPVGLCYLNTDLRFIYINEWLATINGITVEEHLGRTVGELLPDVAAGVESQLRHVIETGQPIVDGMVEAETRAAPGVKRYFQHNYYAVKSDDGTVMGVSCVVQDITERKRLERMQRDFVANVSHEFKTPLTVIQGSAETLLDEELKDPQDSREFLKIIRDHALRLGRLTDGLLKLSQIDAGKLELEFRSVRLSEVIEACAKTTRYRCDRKQLTLLVHCPSDLPPARGDAGWLREVVQNLLDNAVQYTSPGGRITVQAGIANGQLKIAVSDTGIGIPRAEQERIFERFYRVDAARSRDVGGTGLGLSITKHLVEAHGGRIEIDSEDDRGSTFTVFLPTD